MLMTRRAGSTLIRRQNTIPCLIPALPCTRARECWDNTGLRVGAAFPVARQLAYLFRDRHGHPSPFSRLYHPGHVAEAAPDPSRVRGRAPAELQRRIETLGAVSAADVQAYAAITLVPARRRVVVAGEAAQFMEALKARGGSITVVPQDALDLERGDSLARR